MRRARAATSSPDTAAGWQITRGKTRSASKPGVYNIIYGYVEEHVGLAAGRLAVRLVNHLVEPQPAFDFLAEVESLVRLAERAAFGPSTQALIDEAVERDIPYIRLNEQSLVQLGRSLDGPWRADDKLACLAAWLALA